jgi:hypothetical protein
MENKFLQEYLENNEALHAEVKGKKGKEDTLISIKDVEIILERQKLYYESGIMSSNYSLEELRRLEGKRVSIAIKYKLTYNWRKRKPFSVRTGILQLKEDLNWLYVKSDTPGVDLVKIKIQLVSRHKHLVDISDIVEIKEI